MGVGVGQLGMHVCVRVHVALLEHDYGVIIDMIFTIPFLFTGLVHQYIHFCHLHQLWCTSRMWNDATGLHTYYHQEGLFQIYSL